MEEETTSTEYSDFRLKVEQIIIRSKFCNVICSVMGISEVLYVELSGTTAGPIGSTDQIVEVDFGADQAVIQANRQTRIICPGSDLKAKLTNTGHQLFHNKEPLYEIVGDIEILEVSTLGPCDSTLRVTNGPVNSKRGGNLPGVKEGVQPRLSSVIQVHRSALSSVNG